MNVNDQTAIGFAVALGVGLLIGAERERRKGSGPKRASAGVRTFAITAVLGALSQHLGGTLLLGVAAAGVVFLSALAYWRGREKDPGLTTEISLLLTLLLGAWATLSPAMAAAAAVIIAILLSSRATLHRFVRNVLTEGELRDALLLGAATLVILPLTPDRYLGPYNALNPRTIWTVMLLIMTISAGGHIATRLVGSRYGLPATGLISGFVSSVATIGAMAARAVRHPAQMRQAVAGAVLSTVATIAQMMAILSMVSRATLQSMLLPLSAAAIVAIVYSILFTARALLSPSPEEAKPGRAFDLKIAVTLVAFMSVVMVIAAALRDWNSRAGVITAAAIAGLVDTHSVAVSVASLVASGKAQPTDAVVPILVAFSSNISSKIGAAIIAGNRRFAAQVIPGLVLVAVTAWGTVGFDLLH
ncbi:MAG: MgtC/SapB family protein [Gammaproteobacteria bacterium]